MAFLISLSFIMFSGVFSSLAYSQCNPARSFSCGNWTDLTYPFWTMSTVRANCTYKEFELRNCGNTDSKFGPTLYFQGQELRVRNINQENRTMRLSLPINDTCVSLSLSAGTMGEHLPPNLSSIHFSYYCHYDKYLPNSRKFLCGNDWVYWGTETDMPPVDTESCMYHFNVTNGTTLDDLRSSTTMQQLLNKLSAALYSGIEVSISPLSSSKDDDKRGGRRVKVKLILILVTGGSGGTALIMCALFFIYERRRKAMYARSSYKGRDVSTDSYDPEKKGALFGVKFFTYDELKEATDNFSENREIGDGSFGAVYLGTLKDGRTVAVKRLYENNWRGVEQFLNEADILAHLRHKNLVTLYGCTSRHSRELLLVYEYISNGTIADHLHGENAQPGSLTWLTRLKIAVETASALTYLHASDIIHRDVKTYNILLDDNFNVKVADFGLSRLFPLNATHVTTAPQGTPGYVDPEYRQCYQLTDKSDVYSFGVVLAELISSKPAVDITRHRHEINLSNMAINKIQSGAINEFVDPSLGFDKDSVVHKMITAVADLVFQCLQSDGDSRPSMQQVSEILTRIQRGDSQTEANADELENSPMPPLSPDNMAAI